MAKIEVHYPSKHEVVRAAPVGTWVVWEGKPNKEGRRSIHIFQGIEVNGRIVPGPTIYSDVTYPHYPVARSTVQKYVGALNGQQATEAQARVYIEEQTEIGKTEVIDRLKYL